jgi:ABC-type multidrug transport system ATPase subunit
MTIHQPNSETYEIFDNLTVLLEGKIIYQAEANQVTEYFSQNFNLNCPEFINAPDFFMSKIHY